MIRFIFPVLFKGSKIEIKYFHKKYHSSLKRIIELLIKILELTENIKELKCKTLSLENLIYRNKRFSAEGKRMNKFPFIVALVEEEEKVIFYITYRSKLIYLKTKRVLVWYLKNLSKSSTTLMCLPRHL